MATFLGAFLNSLGVTAAGVRVSSNKLRQGFFVRVCLRLLPLTGQQRVAECCWLFNSMLINLDASYLTPSSYLSPINNNACTSGNKVLNLCNVVLCGVVPYI